MIWEATSIRPQFQNSAGWAQGQRALVISAQSPINICASAKVHQWINWWLRFKTLRGSRGREGQQEQEVLLSCIAKGCYNLLYILLKPPGKAAPGWEQSWAWPPSLGQHIRWQVIGKGVQVHHVACYQATTPQPPQPQREVLKKYVEVGKFPGKGSRNSPNTVYVPSAPSPQGRRSYCQGTLGSAVWHVNCAGGRWLTQDAAKKTGVKNKGWVITKGIRWGGIKYLLTEDRNERARHRREEFPCTSTGAARKLEADKKWWGKVIESSNPRMV